MTVEKAVGSLMCCSFYHSVHKIMLPFTSLDLLIGTLPSNACRFLNTTLHCLVNSERRQLNHENYSQHCFKAWRKALLRS